MAKFKTLSAILCAVCLLGGPLSAAPKKKTSTPTKKAPVKSGTTKVVKKTTSAAAVTVVPAPAAVPVPLGPGELPLAARAAISMNAATGDVLYERAPDATEYPASATKILTALLVIEAGDLDKEFTVELSDTKVEPSSLEIKPGEVYTRRALLPALLLKSANDVAMALARDNAGSVAAFAEKMNARAEQLGAHSSHFVNPHGLHNAHHFTTARDMAIIARAAMQNPLFRQIVATPQAEIMRGTELTKFSNHNKLLARFIGCTGVKTGYTVPAQQVLVSSAMREGKEVIAVVLHTNKPGIWEDSKLLLTHGLTKLGAPGDPSDPTLPPLALQSPAPAEPTPATTPAPATEKPAPVTEQALPKSAESTITPATPAPRL